MKAIRVHRWAGGKLTLEEVDKPVPAADEVLIKVAAAGVNYADTMMRSGNYLTKPPLPFTLGYEAASTIEARSVQGRESQRRRSARTSQHRAARRICRVRDRQGEHRDPDSPTNSAAGNRPHCSSRG
ncbi:MAG: alcohol dehydrogenase catalytic domain-containing protein [Acidobacteria bacterium]|nr:alcohol dehydrogenase catalytic domain-containing protein [Acidobacteriota bacterium]